MDRVRRVLTWIDTHLLFGLSVFLLAFIPLFPKIPLFDIIPGYIVKVRPEDFLVGLTAFVWLRDAIRRRIQWNTSYFWLVILYAIAGLLSILSGIFLLNTVPFQLLHIGKTSLNWARYLEYFLLFFFVSSALKTKRRIYVAITVITVTLVGVVAYGIGQQYAHFPVYSTMNREYSKGEKLYLQAGARPQSTFAGHYDLAAYLVIVLPLLFSLSIRGIVTRSQHMNRFIFIGLQFSHALGLAMLLMTGSKTSIVGYGVGMLLVGYLQLERLKSQKLRLYTTAVIVALLAITGLVGWLAIPATLKLKVNSVIAKIQSPSDKPADLIGTVMQKDTWSENALKYGLSMGIRLDTLWPQALLGLARNPLLGASYGTLSALDSHAFAEADSTDNNFLRTIGETGILGFMLFYGIILLLLWQAYRQSMSNDSLHKTLAIGLCGSIVGLLLSAFYLDVFAASKVAFTFWSIAALALINPQQPLAFIRRAATHIRHHWPIYLVFVITFFFLHQNPYMVHNETKNIESLSASLQQLTDARCLIGQASSSLCHRSYSVYSFLLAPFLKIFGTEGAFVYLNFTLIFGMFLLIYTWLRKQTTSLEIFTVLSLNMIIAIQYRLSSAPLTNLAFVCLLGGFPLLALTATVTLKKLRTKQKKIGESCVIGLLFLMCLNDIYTHDFMLRFRNIAPTKSYDAVQIDNGNAIPTPEKPSILLSAMNPQFSDIYTNHHYTLLPLTTNISKLFDTRSIYMSDYGVNEQGSAAQNFKQLKAAYTVNYVTLGCSETCDVYALHPATPLISPIIKSAFNAKTLDPTKLSDTYAFTIIDNRFDTKLSPTAFSNTEKFIAQLNAIHESANKFMIISGDAIPNVDPFHANTFASGFVNKITIPVLYAAGNNDLFTKKYYDSEIKTFFTNSEYFILLNVDAASHIDSDQQLKLYDAFLQLEKLPTIKNVFIVAHDANWQTTSDTTNVISILERKLQPFTHLHTYIITANHDPKLSQMSTWYTSKENAAHTITYIGNLSAQTNQDSYLEIMINANDRVGLLPRPL